MQMPSGSSSGKNKKYLTIVIVVIVILVLGFWVNSFMGRRAGENMAEDILESQLGGNVDVDSNGNSVSITTEDGTFTAGESTKWPSDMPSDVPEFTAGELTMAGSVFGDGNGWQVAAIGVSSEDFNAYHSLLKSKGWKDVGVYSAEIGMVQMNKDAYDLFIAFDPEETNFSLTVSFRK